MPHKSGIDTPKGNAVSSISEDLEAGRRVEVNIADFTAFSPFNKLGGEFF
jgi:hypothetical protein